jgi:CRP-like cAMP-binding protein
MNAADYLSEEAILEKIGRMPALESFRYRDLQILLKMSKIRQYAPGELIFKEGSYDGWVYFLLSGRAKIVVNDKELITLDRTGDVFGEMGVVAEKGRSASVYADDETVCLATDVSQIDNLTEDNRFVFRYLIFRGFAEILANRLRITTERLIKAEEEIARLKSATA